MSATATSRVALGVSLVSLGVALLSRCGSPAEPRRGAREAEAPTPAQEAARKGEELAADIAALRREVASLASPAQRDALGPEGAYVMSPAADGRGEFQERRALLTGFQGMESGDRRDALERLSELARLGDAEALAVIQSSLGDSSASVRAAALDELFDLDEPNRMVHLRSAIGDASPKVREVVAGRLDEMPADAAGPMLLGLLRDPDAHVVTEAIESLGDLEFAQARPKLVEQLGAPSLDVATSAARALMKLGDEGAAHGTVQRILSDFAGGGVSGRVKNVKRLRRLKAAGPLENILATDPSVSVREAAREALASLGE